MNDNTKTISFADMNYEVIIRSTNSDRIDFYCESGCKFLESLYNAGYTEYVLTKSQNACDGYARRLKPGSSAPTSCAQTGHIYVPERDEYFNITIENVGNGKYDVIIEKVQIDSAIKAISQMAGISNTTQNEKQSVRDKILKLCGGYSYDVIVRMLPYGYETFDDERLEKEIKHVIELSEM